jgi:hypothetical protein
MSGKIDLRALIILALLTAIGAVFKAFVSFDLFFGSVKVLDMSLIALPVMMAGIYVGPHRHCTRASERNRGRGEGVRGHDHLVAGA